MGMGRARLGGAQTGSACIHERDAIPARLAARTSVE
jgi:hypothetical protein